MDTITSTDITVPAVADLRRAAGLIDRRGHAVGEFETEGGRLCVTGALLLAIFGTTSTSVTAARRPGNAQQWRRFDTCVDALYNRLGIPPSERGRFERVGPVCTELFVWNDATSTDAGQVVRVCRAAADDLAGEAP